MKIGIIEASLSEVSLSRIAGNYFSSVLNQNDLRLEIFSSSEIEEIPLCGSSKAQTTEGREKIDSLQVRLEECDGFVWAVPVYCAGVSSAAKNILDHFSSCFNGKWFSLLAAAGSERSLYAVNGFAMEIINECQAYYYPKRVLVTKKDFDANNNLLESAAQRLAKQAAHFTECVKSFAVK
jgi:NAD(P)H-dependent FMN reductase